MCMKKKWLIIGSCLFIIVIGIGTFLLTSRMKISTVPSNAEIWLDGIYLGDSPMAINILDFKSHRLELKLEKAPDVVYEFDRFSMIRQLDVTSSEYYGYTEESYTIDKRWKLETGYDGVFLVNRNDSNQRIPIIEYEVAEDPINILAPPVRVSISPKGEYAMMVSWLKNDPEEVPAFWLVQVGETGGCIEVFSDFRKEINDAAVTRVLDMGFSPDSKWIWITTNKHFAIASIEHPEEPVAIFDDIHFSWSTDGQWLAVRSSDKEPNLSAVFHLMDGEWKPFLDDISGRPEGFSNDGRYLWTFGLNYHPDRSINERFTYEPVRLIDIQTNRVISTISTENTIRGISTPKESSKSGLFAFMYVEEFSQNPGKGNLMITRKDGTPVTTITDDDYSSVAYWLPDGKHLAVVVHGESGYYIKIINIQDK